MNIAEDQRGEGRMMWNLGRMAGTGSATANEARESRPRASESVGFAAKVIGIGVFAGLMLTYCNALIDACFRGLH
ncbi:MAG TPA: hypothetical protein VMT47_06885 [Polyangia bacterium]|nr:hypothetical protein [Polyangia bacterium]